MRQTGISAQAVAEKEPPRDSASQVTRATLGLREMLLRGAFRPGQRIAEIPLSAKLGVSRTPLRLAFERLAHEGLIKALPHTGFAASEFTLADIWDAIETRGILEGAAARLAAERLNNSAQLEPLRKINRAMRAIPTTNFDSFIEYLELNEAFHMAIVDLANNKILRRAIEQAIKFPFAIPSSRALLPMTFRSSKELVPLAEEHHKALIGAIEHREGARAEALGREHAQVTRRNLENALADPNFMEIIPGARLIKIRSAERA
jgi:GntR family transcriptional regulator, vanillate catabolism transcriptional regulator